MDSASDEHESSAEEGPVARGPRPRSSKNRASEARAQQHFENIRNGGHSRTQIGNNTYTTYHVTERRPELQQKTLSLTLSEALDFPQMQHRHDEIASARTGSCEWLFQTRAYIRWRDQRLRSENYGLWWIKGSPGTGKSTIMKELLKRSHGSKRDEKIISYFFNAKVGGLPSTAKGMYQSLLFQMAKDSPRIETTPSYEVLREYRSSGWPLEKLKELFRDMISSLGGTSMACYIDGVDEVLAEAGDNSAEDILQFFEELATFAARNSLTIHICVSSRISSNALLLHSEQLVLDEEKDHIAGIHQMAFESLGLRDHEFKSTLANCIASSSHGVYRWAIKLIRTLNKRGDFRAPVDLQSKLLDLLVTIEVPEDRSRLKGLLLSLLSIWVNPTQPSQINAQPRVAAVSNTTGNSNHQVTQPKPGQVPRGTDRSTSSNVVPRVVSAQDVRADLRSSTRQHNPRSRPSNSVLPEGSKSSGRERMASAPTTRPVVPRANSAVQSTTRKEPLHDTRALDYQRTVRLSQDTKGPAVRSRDSKRQSQTRIKHPVSLSVGSTPLPEQESSTENSSSPNQKGDAFIPPRSRQARVLASTGTESPPTILTPSAMRRDGHQTQLTSHVGLDTIDGSSRKDAEGLLDITSPTSAQRRTTVPARLQSTSSGAEYADEWLRSTRKHARALFESVRPKNTNWKPVRVAIIGTGLTIHPEYVDNSMARELQSMISKGQITYKDFAGFRDHYDNSSEGYHGTWCALLLLQVAPRAELHIANVLKWDEAAQTPDRVADAIAWAIDREVDLISMPFGWDAEIPKVDKLIDTARCKGILIFAATSNDRGAGRRHESYPANHPTVHGIHSWGGPDCSSRMNPQLFKDKPCFTFPGEQVTILTDTDQPLKDTERRSGTSIATAMATGSAALVLQLARQQLTGPVAKEVERRLKKYEGMSEVFRAMSGEPSADGYYHVRPWTMLGMHKPILGMGANESHQWFTLKQILGVLGRFGDYEDPVT